MKKVIIAFDVDGTLRDNTKLDRPVANERIRNEWEERLIEIIDYTRFEQEWRETKHQEHLSEDEHVNKCGVCNKMKTLEKRAIEAINAAVLELVIGEDIQPKMGGEPIPRGKTVTIDMENNLRESCVFIEDNAKYMLQQKQRETITGKSNNKENTV